MQRLFALLACSWLTVASFGLTSALASSTTAPAALQPVQHHSGTQLDAAKQAGHLGERFDGLLGAVHPSVPSHVAALMERINSERLAAYRQIASQNNASVQAVQTMAGRMLMERSAPGTWVNEGRGWVQRR